jgi:hypothetical protein
MKLRDIKALTPLKFSTSARDALTSIAGTEHVAHDLYSIQTSQQRQEESVGFSHIVHTSMAVWIYSTSTTRYILLLQRGN